MNIIDAVKAMKDGKKVGKGDYGHSYFFYKDRHICFYNATAKETQAYRSGDSIFCMSEIESNDFYIIDDTIN